MKIVHAGFLVLILSQVAGVWAEPDWDEIDRLKERTVELLRGGDSMGPRRSEVTELSDLWCGETLEQEFEPVERVEEDPIETTRLAGARAQKIRQLAFAFSDRNGAYHQSPVVLERVSLALVDLLEMYQTDAAKEGNWHTWLIAIPNNVLPAGLLMERALAPELLEQLIETMSGRLERMVLTGANASWEARNHIYLALLTDDPARLAEAAERVFVDVRYGSVSGVREDYGYLFHGQIPYAGVYGAGFAQTVSQFIYLFSVSPWAISEEKADLVTNLLLEHSRWFIMGDRFDRTVLGRVYDENRSTGVILEAMLYLAHSDGPRTVELSRSARGLIEGGTAVDESIASWADELMASAVEGDLPAGFRYWPSAEVGVYRGEGFHVGFRQYSRRVQDYEYLILKGGEGWNLAMGAIDLIRFDGSGSWYDRDGLLEAIDMEFLPGATSRASANPINPTDKFSGNIGFSLNYGTSGFAGGCGWEASGVAGFILAPPYGGITARKSLHFFPRGYWAIGSGISTTEVPPDDSGHVRTNVIQWPTGDPHPELEVSGNRMIEVSEFEMIIEQVDWLWADGLGVVFSEPTDARCSQMNGVVTIWLDHGLNPEAAEYAFAVLPIASVEETVAFSAEPSIAPRTISESIHAVSDPTRQTVSLVFFEPGEFGGIRVDQPAIVHLDIQEAGTVLTLQNPLHSEETIHPETDLKGEITFSSPEISSEDGTLDRFAVATNLGRVYRAGTGEAGKALLPIQREDLADLHRFKVTAVSDMDETRLTLRLPINWRNEDFRVSIHGRLGHHLTYLEPEDMIEELPDDTLVYRWDRSLQPTAKTENRNLLQCSGDFRIWYETEINLGTDYFSVPLFDAEGNEVDDPDAQADRNSPYRPGRSGQ